MKPLLAIASGCLVLTSPAFAAESAQLDEINVTATRTARTVDETLAPVEVITRPEIERSQAINLIDLLAGRPGIDLVSRGGYGSVSSLFLRGTKSEHLLVLIDGVRIGSVSSGGPSLHTLPLSQIERIEIVRGPRSSLYGADAVGGVIQIFTRKGETGIHPSASITVGSNNTKDISASLSAGTKQTRYHLGLAYLETDGISAIKDNNPDDDGYSNRSLNASLGHTFSGGQQVDLQFLRTQGSVEYDDSFDITGRYENDFVQQVANAKLSFTPLESWDVILTLGESRDETDDLVYGEINTRRKQASWQNDLNLTQNQILTAGIDLLRDSVSGSLTYAEDTRDNQAIFTQYQGAFGQLNLTAGLRHDDNEAFGNHTTGNLSLGHAITSQVRGILSYGTAFRAPSFNDLYYPGFSNPELQPEESTSYELGFTGDPGWGSWELRAFRTEIDNMIQYNPNAGKPENIAAARIDGLETRIDTRLLDWDLSTSLTLLDPRDESTDQVLQRRARKTLRIDADRTFGKTGLGLSFIAQGSREDLDYSTWPATSVTLSGYGLVDLRASRQLSSDWVLRGQIKNLFDKEYETVYNYNTLGRELFISIAYLPGT